MYFKRNTIWFGSSDMISSPNFHLFFCVHVGQCSFLTKDKEIIYGVKHVSKCVANYKKP